MIKVTRSFVASCRTNYNLMTSFNAAEFGRQPFITILRAICHFIYCSGCDGGNTLGNNVADKPFPLAGGLCIVAIWFWTSLSCWMGLNVQSMQPHLLIWNYLDGWLLVHLKFLNSPRYQSNTVFQIEALTRAQRYDCYGTHRLVEVSNHHTPECVNFSWVGHFESFPSALKKHQQQFNEQEDGAHSETVQCLCLFHRSDPSC